LVVNEVPLLFEAGMEDEFDVIVVVDAPEGERERRLESARGIPAEEARRIMAAQGDAAAKRNRADYVLDNAGSLEALEASALALLDHLRAKTTAERAE
jgi:dephospho-CoA kinase